MSPSFINEIFDESFQPRGSLELVLRFAEDQVEQALVLSEFLKDETVMLEKIVACILRRLCQLYSEGMELRWPSLSFALSSSIFRNK
jgi:hypothetical protein